LKLKDNLFGLSLKVGISSWSSKKILRGATAFSFWTISEEMRRYGEFDLLELNLVNLDFPV